jgi:hypothetical protein
MDPAASGSASSSNTEERTLRRFWRSNVLLHILHLLDPLPLDPQSFGGGVSRGSGAQDEDEEDPDRERNLDLVMDPLLESPMHPPP